MLMALSSCTGIRQLPDNTHMRKTGVDILGIYWDTYRTLPVLLACQDRQGILHFILITMTSSKPQFSFPRERFTPPGSSTTYGASSPPGASKPGRPHCSQPVPRTETSEFTTMRRICIRSWQRWSTRAKKSCSWATHSAAS